MDSNDVVKPIDRKGKPGRPKKSELQAVRDSRKGALGRPKGDNSRMQEFKERLLATGGTKIIDKMVKIALDDDHPGQMAAIKLAMDRMLPTSLFEASKAGGGTPVVTINIQGMGEAKTEIVEDITDVEVKSYGES